MVIKNSKNQFARREIAKIILNNNPTNASKIWKNTDYSAPFIKKILIELEVEGKLKKTKKGIGFEIEPTELLKKLGKQFNLLN